MHGLRFFFAGWPLLLRHPSLLALSLLPIVITVAMLVLIALGCAYLAGLLVGDSVSPFGEKFVLLGQALVFVLALLLGYLLFLPLARVVLAPFSEALSRKTQAIAQGAQAAPSSLGWRRAMWEGAKLVAFQLVVTALVLLLSIFAPPVGAPLGIAVAILFCGLDYLDVPLSVRGLSLGKKLGVMWRHKSLAAGFGLAGYALLLIPLVNLLSLPVGVISATLLVNGIEAEERERGGDGATG
jgi:CysZ protein